ncbi:MAG: bifunctional nuclease family protein [Actinomycetota bacterium]
MLVEMNLAGVRIELPSNQPIVLLRESAGSRFLPIWIGPPEAASIANALQGSAPPRPNTHDLMCDLLREVGVTVVRVAITELRDGTFYAVIAMRRNGSEYEVSARPSDAIAVAVRLGCKILASSEVLDEASITLDGEGDREGGADPEAEVERFRAFLEGVTPEDFGPTG